MTLIALIRGVNVGGNKMLSMAVLKELCVGLGLEDVQTVLQSGNVVFRSAKKISAKTLENAILEKTGLDVRVFLRTPAEMEKVIAQNPFPEEAKSDPGHLVVMFLERELTANAKAALRDASAAGPERVRIGKEEIYVYYPEGMGRSKLVLDERRLGVSGTARNWNTVARLLARSSS
ncbi:MAG TPA: DUF1697 domain-containing protein [Thermoanaerobaculia bacterium]|nr:DUF1697 domain-containing protein [Thermoanaerobaculia bacterium]